MRPPSRIHIVGASGSGTTSLGVAIAARFGHRHLDTDDFFWMRTDPPYRVQRPREERLASLSRALRESPAWVLSGSLCGWGDPLIPEFELVVFLVVPTPIRLARLRAREVSRYGRDAIAPGGTLHGAQHSLHRRAPRGDRGLGEPHEFRVKLAQADQRARRGSLTRRDSQPSPRARMS